MQQKQLYIAYGSNINLEQMAYRCPHSKVLGISEINDFELEFRSCLKNKTCIKNLKMIK